MAKRDGLDPAAVFGATVVDAAGSPLGRVTALIHRGGGCDVLVQRRRWLRHTVVRLDLAELVPARGGYRHLGRIRSSSSRGDGWVA